MSNPNLPSGIYKYTECGNEGIHVEGFIAIFKCVGHSCNLGIN